jgi:formamidopyrimidine-DNA glycosylase
MPELPDVEVFRRLFEQKALNLEIAEVAVNSPEMLVGIEADAWRSKLVGSQFTETLRHGKHLLTALSGGAWVVWHFGMSGFFSVFARMDEEPPHDRVRIDFASGSRLGYSCQRKLGEVGLTPSPDTFLKEKGLGPDALDPSLDRSSFVRSLSTKRGTIKSALMDQKLLAGVGNVYSDEILFQASVYPGARTSDLQEERLAAIHEAMRRVLQQAIDAGADPQAMPEGFLLPRRESDASCPRCGGSVEKKKFSGRSGFYCPSCQSV